MFKKYLRIQPASIQLVIFLSFWSVLLLLGQFALPLYFKLSLGVTADKLPQFIEKDMYNHPNVIFISNAIFQVMTFLLPAFVFAYLADPQPLPYLGVIKVKKPVQIVGVVILALSLIFFVSPLATWLKEINLGNASRALDEQRDKIIASYLSAGDTLTTIRSILLIAIVPAICEEFFFRGILMKMVHSFVPKWWFSIGLSALIFAAFHTTISEFVPIFIAGIVLGMVYYLTSSLWMNVLLHLIFNGVQVLSSIYSNPQMDKALDNNSTVMVLFGTSILLVAACLYFLFKNKTPLPEKWSVVVPEITAEKCDINA